MQICKSIFGLREKTALSRSLVHYSIYAPLTNALLHALLNHEHAV